MHVAMAVAEPSGDNIAADLIRAMKLQQPDIQVSGICGPAMIQEGASAVYGIDDIGSLGIEGLYGRLRKILKIRRNFIRLLLADPPDVYVGVDAPDFNLSVEQRLRHAGIPTLQYVAPTVWAWRRYRIRRLKRAVERLLTIYPFESDLFDRVGISHRYIGHPLADQIAARNDRTSHRALGLSKEGSVIAILPGSRVNEVDRLSSIFLETALELSRNEPQLEFVAPFVDESTRRLFLNRLAQMKVTVPVHTVLNDSLSAIEAADVVIAASGTAVLETALCGKPVVVSYRLSQLSYYLLRVLTHTSHYCMLNHFEHGPIIPEFMQKQCTVENLTSETLKILRDSNYRQLMVDRFAAISRQLKCSANQLAAQEILRVAGR